MPLSIMDKNNEVENVGVDEEEIEKEFHETIKRSVLCIIIIFF